jgi:hypothetical protein
MLVCLYDRGMIAVFPENPFAVLPLVIYRSSSDQLHALRNNVFAGINNQKMNVI